MSSDNDNHSLYATGLQRWLITATVMLVAFVEILDMTIVNVSLPQMMGSLGANADQITWVLTSYIVASAIFMPLTGFLVQRIGRKRLLLINTAGFLFASILCGTSTTLAAIVGFRVLQGMFGAALVPTSQFILRDTFAKHEQGMAMAIWGMGIMVAPVIGPVLGGYITEIASWRWVFYINIPFCVTSFILALSVIKETPRKQTPIDWFGMGLMALSIGSLQIFLDRGNQQDWLQSRTIQVLLSIAVLGAVFFIIRGIRRSNNIINLSLFKNRNFATSSLMMAVFSVALFGTMAVQPLQLEQLMHYPAELAGLVLAPRGLITAITMVAIGPFVNRIDIRLWVIAGLLLSAYGTYLLTQLSLDANMVTSLIWPNIYQGVGMGLFFIPVTTASLITLPEHQVAEAAGLFSFSRTLGSSIGISIVSSVTTRAGQINWQQIGKHISIFNPNLTDWLSKTGMNINHPQTVAKLGGILKTQATQIAYNDAYVFVMWSFLIMLPLVFILGKGQGDSDTSVSALAH